MSVAWRYTPPTVDAAAAVHVAAEAAVVVAAEHLLEVAKKRVPVETERLRKSGRVTADGLEAAVSFGREDDADIIGFDEHDRAVGSSPSAAYAEKQHEDLSLHHPNGGGAKYLEQPMHSEAETIAQSLAETLRRALQA